MLGEIDLDPASNALAQKLVKARKYYSEKQDGRKQRWEGRVFLNPPYKYPLIEEFINKLCQEFTIGNVTAAVLLTNNNTDTKWWHGAAKIASAVCFTEGRINFYKARPMGERRSQPTARISFISEITSLALMMNFNSTAP